MVNISIVLATYNGEKYIEAQLQSIFSQTLQPAEIIVCDDKSTDNTYEILEKYADKGQIQLFQNEKNEGVVSNFKKGASLAKEKNYIAFCDQDDVWIPEKLEKLNILMQSIEKINTPCLVYSDLILVDKELNIINSSFWNELNHHHHEHNFTTLLYGNFVTGCTMFINSNMKNHFLRMPDEPILHDVWLAFVAFGIGEAHSLKLPLVYYRQHSMNVNYMQGNIKKSYWADKVQKLKMLFTKNNYLEQEFKIAKAFLKNYDNILDEEKLKLLKKFIELEKKSFYVKYTSLKNDFNKYWK